MAILALATLISEVLSRLESLENANIAFMIATVMPVKALIIA